MGTVGTKDKGLSWAEFKDALPKVQQPYGYALKAAFAASQECVVPAEVLPYGENGVNLMKLCMALQDKEGEAPFFLASRSAGEILKLHFTSISTFLRVFVTDGLLTLIERGSGKRASRYKIVLKK